MKSSRPTLRLSILAGVLLLAACTVSAAGSTELIEARARLLEAYQNGQTENDNNVKQLRAKIDALEYVAAAKAKLPHDEPQLISVDFPGGPASALIAAIAKKDRDNNFNVIGEKADLATELPAFSVRNADPGALAVALNGILQPRGYILAPSGRVREGQSPVFTLRKLIPHEADQRQLSHLQSFQLAPYLEHQSVDDIVGAIRAAWELDPARNPAALRLKFHPPTGILLVSVPGDGIPIIHSVLKELRRTDSNIRVPKMVSPPTPQKQ
jgi:hypothetical protein